MEQSLTYKEFVNLISKSIEEGRIDANAMMVIESKGNILTIEQIDTTANENQIVLMV
jgi:hypothetical protein